MLIILIMVIMLSPSMINGAEKNLFIDLSVNFFFPNSTDFKNIYSSSVISPRITGGYFITDNFFAFGGLRFYSTKGKTVEWDFDVEMTQTILSLGGGYFKELSEKLGFRGEIALAYISYNEELTGMELGNKGNCGGFILNTSLQYKLSEQISLAFKLGYLAAKDTVDDLTSNFGGINTGLSVIFLF